MWRGRLAVTVDPLEKETVWRATPAVTVCLPGEKPARVTAGISTASCTVATSTAAEVSTCTDGIDTEPATVAGAAAFSTATVGVGMDAARLAVDGWMADDAEAC